MEVSSDKEPIVDHASLEAYVAAIYEAVGLSADHAALMASIQVEADLRGVHTHGIAMTPMYIGRLLDPEGIDPRGTPRVVHSAAAIEIVDADNAMGHIAAHFAMGRDIERARETNIAAVAVRHSNHCGAMAYYPMMALEHDMIGIATTGALPSMAPWGGIDQVIGNNPLAAAIPALEEEPIVVDVAFQNTFPAKIELWRERGWPLPDDWSLGVAGRSPGGANRVGSTRGSRWRSSREPCRRYSQARRGARNSASSSLSHAHTQVTTAISSWQSTSLRSRTRSASSKGSTESCGNFTPPRSPTGETLSVPQASVPPRWRHDGATRAFHSPRRPSPGWRRWRSE